MSPKEVIRLNIDDHVQIGMGNEISNGNLSVYQLNHRNVWNFTVKDKDGNAITNPDLPADPIYTLYGQSGQVRGTFPEGEVIFEYDHAGFTDAELDYFLGELGDSTNKASLACIDILLASAAKRFDYKAGMKDLKASQVFDHLKELKEVFEGKVQDEDDENGVGSVGIFVDRLHPAYTVNITNDDGDVSRRDS